MSDWTLVGKPGLVVDRELHAAIRSGVMPVIGLVTTSEDVIAHR